MNKIQKMVLATTTASGAMIAATAPALAQLGTVTVPSQGYASSVGSLITSILNMVMLLAAILVFMYLIWGGIEWITSGGDKGQTEKARNKITAAIIGLIVLAASYAILQLALSLLGFSGGLEEVFRTGIRPVNQ